MSKNKTHLKQIYHYYNDLDDMAMQFAYDVATLGKKFSSIIDSEFDHKNPWDQGVLVAILTNLLAYVEVCAEFDEVSLEQSMKEYYEDYLKDYRKQAIEIEKKFKKQVKNNN